MYYSKYSFYKCYRDSKKLNNLSLKSKFPFLVEFFNDLNKFKKLKTIKLKAEKKKMCILCLQNYIIIF